MIETSNEIRPAEGPVSASTAALASHRLPSELAGHRQTRVAFIAMMYAVIYLFVWLPPVVRAAWRGDGGAPSTSAGERGAAAVRVLVDQHPVTVAAGLISVTGALVLWAWARRAIRHQDAVCRLGIWMQVLGAFGIAMREQWAAHAATSEPHAMGMSWVAFWILLFPSLVPTFPRRALMGSLIAASMVPLVWGLGRLAGLPPRTAPELAWLFFPGYLAAAAAFFSSHLIYTLGSSASRARKLGSYELGERLAQGGMGEVWKAHHELLKRPAAVKVIRPERLRGAGDQSPEVTLQRFAHEATATAVLESPHTVTVYDYGVTQDGTFYYVMELLNGMDLETLVRRHGPLPSSRVAHLLTQVLRSLADAHAHGLVHRDVKPANIFAARMGTQFDFVKVLDFGLVKAATPGTDGVRLTGDGIASGTPAYMAPEIASAEHEESPAVDIYSLGCVAYWLLTGRLIFEADSSLQMVIRHVRDEPRPPSQVSELPIDPRLEQLVMQMLSKNPNERPRSALALSCEIAAIPFDEPWDDRAALRWWSLHAPELVAGLHVEPADLALRATA